MKGFSIPGSKTGSYVASKRTDEGSYYYDTLANQLGQEKQLALQDISKNYASTIENAYASYLSNQRGIDASAMGQGYKAAYQQAQQEQLASNVAQAGLTAASSRAELETQTSEARSNIDAAYQAEVANLDRVSASFDNYLEYVKTLSNESGLGYLSDEDKSKTVDELYETLYSAQPQLYTDKESNAAKPFSEWLKDQVGTSETDSQWYQWAMSGGISDFMNSVAARKTERPDLTVKQEQDKIEADRITDLKNEKEYKADYDLLNTAANKNMSYDEPQLGVLGQDIVSKADTTRGTYRTTGVVDYALSKEITDSLGDNKDMILANAKYDKYSNKKLDDYPIVKYKNKYYLALNYNNKPYYVVLNKANSSFNQLL